MKVSTFEAKFFLKKEKSTIGTNNGDVFSQSWAATPWNAPLGNIQIKEHSPGRIVLNEEEESPATSEQREHLPWNHESWDDELERNKPSTSKQWNHP